MRRVFLVFDDEADKVYTKTTRVAAMRKAEQIAKSYKEAGEVDNADHCNIFIVEGNHEVDTDEDHFTNWRTN